MVRWLEGLGKPEVQCCPRARVASFKGEFWGIFTLFGSLSQPFGVLRREGIGRAEFVGGAGGGCSVARTAHGHCSSGSKSSCTCRTCIHQVAVF